MQKLHLVGFTTDLDGLIFSARKGSKAGGYMVPLDKTLLATIAEAERLRNGDKSDAGEASRSRARPDSRLTPREIQANLRAGRSIPEVAAEAGVELEWVERFAVPVVAEQAQMVERARSMTYSKARLGQSTQPLGTSVRWNLADKGVAIGDDAFELGWSAFQLQDEVWMIRFRYTSRARLQVAEWELDLDARQLVSRNRLASELGYVEKGRRPPALPPPTTRAPAASPVRVTEEVVEVQPEPDERPAPVRRRRRSTSRRAASRRTAPRKSSAKKATAKRSTTKKSTAKKLTSRKSTSRKSSTRKSTARKSTARRTTTRKSTARKSSARKATSARRPPARKRAGAKSSATRATGRTSTAKRTVVKKRAAAKAPTVTKTAAKRPTTQRSRPAKQTAPRPAATHGAATAPRKASRPAQAAPATAPAPERRTPRPAPAPAPDTPAAPARPRQAQRPRIAGAQARDAAGSKRAGHAAVRRPAAKSTRSRPAPVEGETAPQAPVNDRAANTPATGPLARSLLARRLMARKASQGDGGERAQRPLRVPR